MARSTRYLPYIKDNLEEAGLPEDLAYLAMIESGYNPTAISKAKAVGLWQFIEGTGKKYGLRIDSWVDERREPEKATVAAIKYLAFLHDEFDSWYLAVAAYNAGEGKIGRGVEKFNTNDFWQLASNDYLALETKRYVPKLIAAIIIASRAGGRAARIRPLCGPREQRPAPRRPGRMRADRGGHRGRRARGTAGPVR